MKTQTFNVLTDDEVQQLVKDNFGLDFELVAEEEWNEGYHKVSAESRRFPDTEKQWVERWVNGSNNYPYIHNIMCYLAATGVIPEGEYLIEVSW